VYHRQHDGDNDAHYHLLGHPINSSFCAKRIGEKEAAGTFAWLSFGHRTFYLERGLNTIYIGGRSRGFGIDRVVFFLHRQFDLADIAENPSTPETERTTDPTIQPGPSTLNVVELNATDFPYQSAGFKTWKTNPKVIYKTSSGPGELTTDFPGPDNVYSVVITAMICVKPPPSYGLVVDGKDLGMIPMNETSSPEYATRIWENVTVKKGSKITVKVDPTGEPYGAFRGLTFRGLNPVSAGGGIKSKFATNLSQVYIRDNGRTLTIYNCLPDDRLCVHGIDGRLLSVATAGSDYLVHTVDSRITGLVIVSVRRNGATVRSLKRTFN
jgi:hypothetical protein